MTRTIYNVLSIACLEGEITVEWRLSSFLWFPKRAADSLLLVCSSRVSVALLTLQRYLSGATVNLSDISLLELSPPRIFACIGELNVCLFFVAWSSAILIAHEKEIKQGSDDNKKRNKCDDEVGRNTADNLAEATTIPGVGRCRAVGAVR